MATTTKSASRAKATTKTVSTRSRTKAQDAAQTNEMIIDFISSIEVRDDERNLGVPLVLDQRSEFSNEIEGRLADIFSNEFLRRSDGARIENGIALQSIEGAAKGRGAARSKNLLIVSRAELAKIIETRTVEIDGQSCLANIDNEVLQSLLNNCYAVFEAIVHDRRVDVVLVVKPHQDGDWAESPLVDEVLIADASLADFLALPIVPGTAGKPYRISLAEEDHRELLEYGSTNLSINGDRILRIIVLPEPTSILRPGDPAVQYVWTRDALPKTEAIERLLEYVEALKTVRAFVTGERPLPKQKQVKSNPGIRVGLRREYRMKSRLQLSKDMSASARSARLLSDFTRAVNDKLGGGAAGRKQILVSAPRVLLERDADGNTGYVAQLDHTGLQDATDDALYKVQECAFDSCSSADLLDHARIETELTSASSSLIAMVPISLPDISAFILSNENFFRSILDDSYSEGIEGLYDLVEGPLFSDIDRAMEKAGLEISSLTDLDEDEDKKDEKSSDLVQLEVAKWRYRATVGKAASEYTALLAGEKLERLSRTRRLLAHVKTNLKAYLSRWFVSRQNKQALVDGYLDEIAPNVRINWTQTQILGSVGGFAILTIPASSMSNADALLDLIAQSD